MPSSGRKSTLNCPDQQDLRRSRTGNRIPDVKLENFAHLGVDLLHPAGTVIFSEGSTVDDIYLIQSGQIKLRATTPGGRTMILRIARPGDILGLSAALNRSPYEVTAETLTPCTLTHIAQTSFFRFVETAAYTGLQALLVLARDHQEIFLCARRLALFPLASSRIAQVLIELAHSNLSAKPGSPFLMVLSHAELASFIGTSRETVTRLLNQLERSRIIARKSESIKILQLSKLEQLAR